MEISEAFDIAAMAAGLGALWVAFHFGKMAAEVRFMKSDAARYAALRRRQVTINNGSPLMSKELDSMCDELALRDAIDRHETPNVELRGAP